MGYIFFLILAQNTKVLEFDFIEKRQLKIHNGHVIKVFMNLKKNQNLTQNSKVLAFDFIKNGSL
jgi:hypothetical protein